MKEIFTALVTGANRGLGYQVAKELSNIEGIEVVLTSRNKEKGMEAVNKLKKENAKVEFFPLDVTDGKSINSLYDFIMKKYGKLDILINNAGVLLDNNKDSLNIDIKTVRETLETNFYGPLLLCQEIYSINEKK